MHAGTATVPAGLLPATIQAAIDERMQTCVALLGDDVVAQLDVLTAPALAALAESTALFAPVDAVAPTLARLADARPHPHPNALASALVCLRLRALPANETVQALPPSVRALYPAAVERVLLQLAASGLPDAEPYGPGTDAFLKDLRLAAGLSVPCGTHDVDLVATLNRRSGLKALLREGDLRGGLRVLRDGGPVWFRIHTDTRNLDDFDADGRVRCLLRIADLLRQRPHVKGMVGMSWYYDPVVARISPRLAYLQALPLANGAYLMRNGEAPEHTAWALASSPTRRALHARGAYRPAAYSLVWKRRHLLAWAATQAG